MAIQPFRDIGLKSLAIGLAVLLWLTVGSDPQVERGLEVPLEFENVPVELEIMGEPPKSVQIRVRGAETTVNRLEPGSVIARLDLSGESPGRRLFDLFGGEIQVPAGVEVTHVVPPTVTLTLERAGSPKAVPIVPDIEGEPAPGYAVGIIETEPGTVEVVGAETLVALVQEALTESVSIDGAMSDVVEDVTVGVGDPFVRLVSPQTARVTVKIVPAPLERTLREVPVVVEGRRAVGVVLEPPHVTVRIVGPHSVVLAADDATIRAFVDLSGLVAGQHTVPVAVSAGEDIRIGGIEPSAVAVTLR